MNGILIALAAVVQVRATNSAVRAPRHDRHAHNNFYFFQILWSAGLLLVLLSAPIVVQEICYLKIRWITILYGNVAYRTIIPKVVNTL